METREPLHLNDRAWQLAEKIVREAAQLQMDVHQIRGGGRVLDAGIEASGGIAAGVALARLCLANLGDVSVASGTFPTPGWPQVVVRTDHPVAACMASQYAGWQIAVGEFFAMGSGPMRAAYGREELFDDIGYRERPRAVVGVLEADALPDQAVLDHLSDKLNLGADRILLAAAPAKSIAGGAQVVARSVETVLHKLHSLRFDLDRVVSGFGAAPLPPPSKDFSQAIGRTNDAVLYGAQVTLFVRGDAESLWALGPRVPATASRDYGAPFAEIFARYDHDFYKIDPELFSPAEITFCHLDSGAVRRFGAVAPEVLKRSFGIA